MNILFMKQWTFNAHQLVKPAVRHVSFLQSWKNRGEPKHPLYLK